jgi:hypothetical protein
MDWFPMSVADMCAKSALNPARQEVKSRTDGHLFKEDLMSDQEKIIDEIFDSLFVTKTSGVTGYERSRFNAIKKRYLETYGGEENFYVQRRRWEKGWEKPDDDYEEFKKIEKQIWASVLEERNEVNNEGK